MDDYRQQQIDVLKEAVPYSEKLIGAIEKVSEELSGFLKYIMELRILLRLGQLTRQKLILALRSFQRL